MALELADQLDRSLGGRPRHSRSRVQGCEQIGHRGPRVDLPLENGRQVLDVPEGGNSSLRPLESGAERDERVVHRIGRQRMLPREFLGVERAGRGRVAGSADPASEIDRTRPEASETRSSGLEPTNPSTRNV